jgi:glycosyltransferase 2 family protein
VPASVLLPKHVTRSLLLAVGVSLASLAVLLALSRQDPGRLAATLAGLDPGLIGLALLLHALLWVAWAARVQLLAGAVGIRVAYLDALRAVLAGSFAASVTPAMLGGEAVRGYALARGERQVGRAGAAILSERLLDMLFFLAGGAAFAALNLPFLRGPIVGALAAAMGLLGFGLGMVLLAALRPRRVRAWSVRVGAWASRGEAARSHWPARAGEEFDRFREGLAVLGCQPRALAGAALLTAVMWTAEMGVLATLLAAFGATLPFTTVMLAGMLLMLMMTTPVVPGGSGIAEVGAAALFGALVPGLSPLFAAAWRGCTFYMNLAVGGWAAARLWRPTVNVPATGPEAAR